MSDSRIGDSAASSRQGRRRIPCLDGLRAISIALVLLDHGRKASRYTGFPELRWIPFTGTTGVCLFFVISGFLITTLLLNEKTRCGQISLPRFYIRRALRIFPPYYCYLLFAVWLRGAGLVHFSGIGLLSSATYWRNFYNGSGEWVIDHTWSLSIEEQFYLIWPLVIACLSVRQSIGTAVIVILTWPLLHLLRHGFLFAGTGHVALETAALDTILYGSLLALLAHSQSLALFKKRMGRSAAGLVIPVLVLCSLYLTANYWPRHITFILPLLRNLALCGLLGWCVCNPQSAFGRVLEWRPVAFVGVISYSLYLWQQPFVGFYRGWICRFPRDLVAAFTLAILSHLIVERPFDYWRRRWSAGAIPPGCPSQEPARGWLLKRGAPAFGTIRSLHDDPR